MGLCGIIVYRSLYFGIFDTIKRFLCGEEAFNDDGKPVKMSLFLSFISAQVCSLKTQCGTRRFRISDYYSCIGDCVVSMGYSVEEDDG